MNPSWLLLIIIQLLAGPPLDVQLNPSHPLPTWFDPGLQPAAVQALDAMQENALEDGVHLLIYSGYRSYLDQKRIFAREQFVHQDLASAYIAKAGQSEHQLGTAFDVVWPGLKVEMLDPRNLELYDWLETNAYQYGFVISYPFKTTEDWPYSNRWMPGPTAFIYEPWHIRYVGIELAEAIFAAGYLEPDSSILPQTFYRSWP